MKKTILITGATDGIGFETASKLAETGHTLLVHGRNPAKLEATIEKLKTVAGAGNIVAIEADLSDLAQVDQMASDIAASFKTLDVIINNAGLFKMANPRTETGHDLRFVVNTLAPWLLTQKLLPLMPADGRVVNLSSAAQTTVDLDALAGKTALVDNAAYAQSKLALTMWSFHLDSMLKGQGPAIIAVNPGSFLASKMVKEAYGMAGHDLSIGADILYRAALSDEFADAGGKYYDNDRRAFSAPHPDALDQTRRAAVVEAIERVVSELAE